MKKLILTVLIFLLIAPCVDAAKFYNWRRRVHATDCTAFTDGKLADQCHELDANTLYVCVPDNGVTCLTAGEWKKVSSPTGGGGATQLNELTDVNTSTATSGNFLLADGTDFESQAMSGDVTMSGAGATVVANDSHAHTSTTVSGLAVADFTSPNISNWTNNSGYVTAASTSTFTNKSGNNSQWTNDASYITASSSDNLTNKTGNNSQWTNDAAYSTATSTTTFTNKSGSNTQWTNDEAYLITEVDGSITNELQNLFLNVAVSGQNTIIADGQTDTLTFAAGSNVTITTDNSTDTVTIASSSDAEVNNLETVTTDIAVNEVPTGTAGDTVVYKLLPDCNVVGSALAYEDSTQTWSCRAGLGGGSFDSTTVDDTTWSDGANAANTWTFDVTGTNHTMIMGNNSVSFSNDLSAGGTLNGIIITEDGNAVYNATETPGGELGGTFASFTVDAIHSGSAHHTAATVADTATLDMTLTGQEVKGDVILLKDLVTTAPITGGTDNILVGADADVTIAITVLKDIVTTAPLTGAEDNVLPGADADLTLAITVLKDLVTTAPLTGGTDDIFTGSDADITVAMPVATTSADGYLSQTDWDTFNEKANQLTDLSDVNSSTDTAGNMLIADGSGFDSAAMSGHVTITSAGVTSLNANDLSNDKDVLTWNSTSEKFQWRKGEECKTGVIENLAAADDNWELGTFNYAVNITKIGLHCKGTCTTPAQISLEDRAGNAMTHTTPVASLATALTTFYNVTAGNALTIGEGFRFDVDNAVSPETDDYTINYCFERVAE